MNQKETNLKLVPFLRSPDSKVHLELIAQIKDGPKLCATKALEVYQQDYYARLTEALKNTFEAVYSLVGTEDFLVIACDYIKTYTSCSADLDDYGNHLSSFLLTHPFINDYPFLAELADFEWNFKEIFHTEQMLGLDNQTLMEILKSELSVVQLVDSLKILNYNYQINSLYQLKDENIEGPFDYKIPEYLIMIKNNLLVQIHQLSKNQWLLVKNLLTPNSFLDIFQNAPAKMTPVEIQSLFQILGLNRLLLKLK